MVVRFPLASACDEVASVDMMSTTSKNGSYGKVDSDEFSLEAWWPCSATEAKHHNHNPKYLFYKIHLDEYKHLLSSPIT